MSTFLGLARETVRLEWRLVAGEYRTHTQDLTVLAIVAAFVLAVQCEAAADTSRLLAGSPPSFVRITVAGYSWATWGGAIFLALATGVHATMRRLAVHLALLPVTRLEVFASLQAVTLCGRYGLVGAVSALPLLFLLAGFLDPASFAAAIVGIAIVLRMVPAVVGIVVFAALGLNSRALLVICAAALGLAVATYSLSWTATLISTLPPNALARIVMDDGTRPHAWAALLVWTLVIGALEFVVLASDRSRAVAPRAGIRIGPIPTGITVVARLCAVSAPVLHVEWLRLVRWRRFLLGWCFALVFIVAFTIRSTPVDSVVVPTLVLMLSPALIAVSTMTNVFAPDGAGVQAFFLVLDRPGVVIRAKIVAIGLFAGAAGLVALGLFLFARPGGFYPAGLYSLTAAGAFFIWGTATGRVSSVLFPTPTDPHGVGGGLIRGAGLLVGLVSNGVFLGACVATAFLYDTQRLDALALLMLGCGLVVVAVLGAHLAARAMDRVLLARREQLTGALTAGTTVS